LYLFAIMYSFSVLPVLGITSNQRIKYKSDPVKFLFT
jgi:hypothetical protein